MIEDTKNTLLKEIRNNQKKIDESIKDIRKQFKLLHKTMRSQVLLMDGLRTELGKSYTYTLSKELDISSEDVKRNHSNYLYSSKQAAVDAEILRRFDLLIRNLKG